MRREATFSGEPWIEPSAIKGGNSKVLCKAGEFDSYVQTVKGDDL